MTKSKKPKKIDHSSDPDSAFKLETIHPDGHRTLIYKKTGWKIELPPSIKVFDPVPPSFAPASIDRAWRAIRKSSMRLGAWDLVGPKTRTKYFLFYAPITPKGEGRGLTWVLYGDHNSPDRDDVPYAAGWFLYQTDDYGEYLAEARAAILPEHAGQGLYPIILKALKEDKKQPLYSDKILSAANIKTWSTAGVYDALRGRFRINPRMLLGAIQRRVKGLQSFLVSEVAMGEKGVKR